MPKKRNTLSSFIEPIEPLKKVEDIGKTFPNKSDAPRIIKQTLYLPEPVHEQLRIMAFQERCEQHDLLMECLDRVFKAHGLKSIEELTRK
jgi:hypothetical protein